MPSDVKLRPRKEASPTKKKQAVESSSSEDTALARSSRLSFNAMITLLVFSTAMCTLPLGTYFLIHRYIVHSTTIAAMGAIVMVQIIVAVYIYKAWHDETKEHESDLRTETKPSKSKSS